MDKHKQPWFSVYTYTTVMTATQHSLLITLGIIMVNMLMFVLQKMKVAKLKLTLQQALWLVVLQ